MRGDVDKTGLVLALLTLSSVAAVGILVVDGMGGDWDKSMNSMCQDEYGDGWELDDDAEVLMCENEAGQTAEFPMETNLDGDHLALPKVSGVVVILSVVVVQFNSFLQRYRDE